VTDRSMRIQPTGWMTEGIGERELPPPPQPPPPLSSWAATDEKAPVPAAAFSVARPPATPWAGLSTWPVPPTPNALREPWPDTPLSSDTRLANWPETFLTRAVGYELHHSPYAEVVWCRGRWQCWLWAEALAQRRYGWGYGGPSPYPDYELQLIGCHPRYPALGGWDTDLRSLLLRDGVRDLSPEFNPEATYGPERMLIPSTWRLSRLKLLPPPSAESGAALQLLQALPASKY
jgi:hypothetical protein